MKRRVELDYSLGEGWLAPWLEGLRQGKAVASTCGACGAAQFPPLRICPACRVPSDGWSALGGGATILFRTIGTDGDFALVRFDGAEGAALARASALPQGADRAVIGASPNGPPVISLKSEPSA